MNDLTQERGFRDHPFAVSHPSLRFYGVMPINTKSGVNVGSLSVMDERPKEGLDDAGIKFLGDMAIAIMAHLETTIAKEKYGRSGKMIQGLGLFMEGRAALHDWWLKLGINKPREQHGRKDGTGAESTKEKHKPELNQTSASERHGALTRTAGADAAMPLDGQSATAHSKSPIATQAEINHAVDTPPSSTVPGVGDVISARSKLTTSVTVETAQVRPSVSSGGQQLPPAWQNLRSYSSGEEDDTIPEDLGAIFLRASKILQQCIEVDGAVFFEASVRTMEGGTGEVSRTLEMIYN